ncbi:MAG: hypothetical protein C9356_12010 [Oleiphilus sp.]|nr:MAG: hypothetical protein C9356_12010 [Oleiphilus sp.]
MMTQLDTKTIKAIEQHLQSGYYPKGQSAACGRVILAIKLGKIRISKERSDDWTFKELAGDLFSEEANPDISPKTLRKQAAAFKQRIYRAGVWTMVSEYWTGREWESLTGIRDNSIGGFVGSDFFGSGYELQIMESALTAYEQQDLDDQGFVIDPFLKAA